MKIEEKLLRKVIRESIKNQQNINEFNIGNFFNSKKTSDNAVEAAKKILDGHLSGKFEKSPEILKKAYSKLSPEDQKSYSAKFKNNKNKDSKEEPKQKQQEKDPWSDDSEANKLDRNL